MSLEPDSTVLFAKNRGGKTSILTALAMGLAVFQPKSPEELKFDPFRDTRQIAINKHGKREHAGACEITWSAISDNKIPLEWTFHANTASGRQIKNIDQAMDAIEAIRTPGVRWPLFAWYGTERMRKGQRHETGSRDALTRWDGYKTSLNPAISDAPLLDWFSVELFGDVVRSQQNLPERRFGKVIAETIIRATPDIANIWYDPVIDVPVIRFQDDKIETWTELSDGYHIFLALIGDIARRILMLNESDGTKAPELAEGIVLIDEIDLHLHPLWQRKALTGLRKAFPKLQFIVTTHSPQVLSNTKNRQVRRLVNWQLQEHNVFVEGRDSNSILCELMSTNDRDEEGVRALRELYNAIDKEDRKEAKRIYEKLLGQWGDLDPELIRAEGFMDWED